MIPDRYNPVSRLPNTSITTKLNGIVVIFLLAITGLILMMSLAFYITTGLRAYVIGEGLWSKGQKDAVYFLSRYAQTQSLADYAMFVQGIAMPQGDRKARIEMDKPAFDRAIVNAGFVEGGLSLEDTPAMICLYRHFQGIEFFAKSISIWKSADAHVDELLAIAAEIHNAIITGKLDATMQSVLLSRISRINASLTPLQMAFSQTLGQGARSLQQVMFISLVIAAIVLALLGLTVAWLISRDLGLSIASLRVSAIRVARGDLNHRIRIRSRDELGELAMVFNEMIERRRDAEVALTTANEFRERVMNSSTNAIYTMDLNGRFSTANSRTCLITGYRLEELLGMTWAAMIPAEYLPELYERYTDTVQGRQAILNYEVPLIRKDGVLVTITFSVTALSRDGTIIGVVGTAEDITERKLAQAELQSRADELARSNQELEQFAYVASHDLQEPLRTVSGFAQLLAKRYGGQLGPEADEYIGFVTSGVQRMKSLIEDLLAYSRVGREPGATRTVDLNVAVSHALANLHGAIESARATVICEPMPTLRANERQMVQLFQNLIGNAVKFRGETPPIIHICAEPQALPSGPVWQITVRDNGIGISERHATQVFVLFQRLHGREKYPGNGIGLTICKKIIDLHGGHIWIVRGDTGAVFRFTLPADDHAAHAVA